jgi:hypothetical protein
MSTNSLETARRFAAGYRTFRGLPALAGLGPFTRAVEPGLSVEETVARLKRHHYALRRLHAVVIARLTGEPVYELKMAFSYHAWLCAELVTALRQRVGELREPPLGLEQVPHAALEVLFDEIQAAPTRAELLLGLYEVVLPGLRSGLERHGREAHLLADQPTVRLCRFAVQDLDDMLAYGRQAITSLVTAGTRTRTAQWISRLREWIAAAGDLDGCAPQTGEVPPRIHSAVPRAYDGRPRRDARFPDPYNLGVNAEVFLYDPAQPADAKVLMMFYKRLREIDVPEMMASILTETRDKPWAYYRDLTRQLWDEARHAMMGEVGFVSVGVDWPHRVMVNFTWSLGLNTQLTPKERHAVLYFIEQGLMAKTGKRHEWEVSLIAQNPLAANFQDFDWADEVLHARIGRDWYLADMPSPKEGVEYGDRCWSKVVMQWDLWRDLGLTEHRNWWLVAYQQYCARQGLAPDPAALAFHVTYQHTRADLRAAAGSA